MDGFEAALEMIKPHATGLVCGSVLSIAFNTVARRNPDARRLVAGTPLYIYAVAMIFQALVFAPAAYSAWSRWNFDPQWMKEGWTTARGTVNVDPMGEKKRLERVYLYALFGYMIKDMWIFRTDVLFFAHHLICLFGIAAFFAIPAGIGAFVVGGTVLELGNFTYNIVLLVGEGQRQNRAREGEALCGVPLRDVHAAEQPRRWRYVRVVRGLPASRGHALGHGAGHGVVLAHRGEGVRAPLAVGPVLREALQSEARAGEGERRSERGGGQTEEENVTRTKPLSSNARVSPKRTRTRGRMVVFSRSSHTT